MRLQNEKLANQAEISELKKTINARQTRQYILWALIVVALIIGYFWGHAHK
jgi:preprotein translocase subunit SecE